MQEHPCNRPSSQLTALPILAYQEKNVELSISIAFLFHTNQFGYIEEAIITACIYFLLVFENKNNIDQFL